MASAGDRTALLKYQCLAADKWSNYPAKSDVDLACHSIRNIESETFCDGTYIGPGGSFDISSGQDIKIQRPDVRVALTASYLGLETTGINTEIRHYDASGAIMDTLVKVEGAGFMTIEANNDNPSITTNAQGGAIYCKMSADGNTNITGLEASGDFKIIPQAGRTTFLETTGADVVVRLENNGGKGGDITASETGGYMGVAAQAGYDLIMESTGGNVDVLTSQPDTKLTAWVNNGTASLKLTDTANAGDAILSANNTVQLSVGGFSPSVLADENSSLLKIDSATGECGLKYDGTSTTPIQFHIGSTSPSNDFLATTAGAPTGQYLRIFVNGTEYKIALLNP